MHKSTVADAATAPIFTLAAVAVAVVLAVAITADVGVGLLPHRGVGLRFVVGVDCLAIRSLLQNSTVAAATKPVAPILLTLVFSVVITADVGVGLLPHRGGRLKVRRRC